MMKLLEDGREEHLQILQLLTRIDIEIAGSGNAAHSLNNRSRPWEQHLTKRLSQLQASWTTTTSMLSDIPDVQYPKEDNVGGMGMFFESNHAAIASPSYLLLANITIVLLRSCCSQSFSRSPIVQLRPCPIESESQNAPREKHAPLFFWTPFDAGRQPAPVAFPKQANKTKRQR